MKVNVISLTFDDIINEISNPSCNRISNLGLNHTHVLLNLLKKNNIAPLEVSPFPREVICNYRKKFWNELFRTYYSILFNNILQASYITRITSPIESFGITNIRGDMYFDKSLDSLLGTDDDSQYILNAMTRCDATVNLPAMVIPMHPNQRIISSISWASFIINNIEIFLVIKAENTNILYSIMDDSRDFDYDSWIIEQNYKNNNNFIKRFSFNEIV